jgi:parallel beta-helix repeat protein
MPGDYTRFTFDPLKGYSGLRKQQGRVSLDADFNEFESILDRRHRAGMYDVVGQPPKAKPTEDKATEDKAVVPQTTPEGFQIKVINGGLTIGRGRAYVDGILVECFGDINSSSQKLTNYTDTHLGGVYSETPLPYEQQPFYYHQPNYPTLSQASTSTTIYLVYLDVWQREVTVWEEDALREPALNGPDTATRVQTAWQVKVLRDVAAGTTCNSEPEAWTELTAPSTARLSTGTLPIPADPGPCVINPAAGYTGLENRLYRVEVHQGGTLGVVTGSAPQATFKWSRDNASLAARVLSIRSTGTGQSIITVGSTGRDSWMRFQQGDHVELLDDAVEFAMRESGVGGTLAKVVKVDQANAEVYVDANLSSFVVMPNRHPRLRRWDHLEGSATAEPLDRPATKGGALTLEDGITITFSGGDGATLHAGDYWVFAARTADGSIELLSDAPPRGILHHFARLALVTTGAKNQLRDCRIPWPPQSGGGCCTVIVQPGESIQNAIYSLPKETGGCVCLKAGIHRITETIKIDRSNVCLHGESGGAEIQVSRANIAIVIGHKGDSISGITVEGIKIVINGDSAPAAQKDGIKIVRFSNAKRVGILETELHVVFGQNKLPSIIGIHGEKSTDVLVRNNVIENITIGVKMRGMESRVLITKNQLDCADELNEYQTVGIDIDLSDGSADQDFLVQDNYIKQFKNGVKCAGSSKAVSNIKVIGNRIYLDSSGAKSENIFVQDDLTRLIEYLNGKNYGIDLLSGRCVADNNHIEMSSQEHGGIRLASPWGIISNNTLISELNTEIREGGDENNQVPVPGSIYCFSDASNGNDNEGGHGSTIRDNTLLGPQLGIVVSEVTDVAVLCNRIEGQKLGWYGVVLNKAQKTTVEGNHVTQINRYGFFLYKGISNELRNNIASSTLRNNIARGNDDDNGMERGVNSYQENELRILGSVITGASEAGIYCIGTEGVLQIAHCRISNCGWEKPGEGNAELGGLPVSGGILCLGGVKVGRNSSIATGLMGVNSFIPQGQINNNLKDDIRVECCEVLETGVAPNKKRLPPAECYGILILFTVSGHVTGNLIATSDKEMANIDDNQNVPALLVVAENALIASNIIRSPRLPALAMAGFRKYSKSIIFSNNTCEHTMYIRGTPTIVLSGERVAANGNIVSSLNNNDNNHISIDCSNSQLSSLVGNITTGRLILTPAGFGGNPPINTPSPPEDYNVVKP